MRVEDLFERPEDPTVEPPGRLSNSQWIGAVLAFVCGYEHTRIYALAALLLGIAIIDIIRLALRRRPQPEDLSWIWWQALMVVVVAYGIGLLVAWIGAFLGWKLFSD
jgi:hypothetical protein